MKLKPPAETFDFKRKFIERAKVLSGRKYAEAYLIVSPLLNLHYPTDIIKTSVDV